MYAQRSGPKIVKGCVIRDRKLRSELLCKQVDFFPKKKTCWSKKYWKSRKIQFYVKSHLNLAKICILVARIQD